MLLPADFDLRIATMKPAQRVHYVKALHAAAAAAKPKPPPAPHPQPSPPAEKPERHRRINQAEAERLWVQRQRTWLQQPDLRIILLGTETHPPMVIPPAPPAYDRELVFQPEVLRRMERLQAHITAVWQRKRQEAASSASYTRSS